MNRLRPLPPPAAMEIHLDVLGGLAGDMFVAAVVDAIPGLAPPLLEVLKSVAPAGASPPRFGVTSRADLRARCFGIERTPVPSIIPRAGHGRSYADLRAVVETAALPETTRSHALMLLHTLAEAEAQVHGVTLERVHFHELADWDSLLDVVAAGHLAAALEGARWTASSLPLGAGRVQTAHGVLPVPAPATVLLLEGYAWHDDGIAGERVTPTGAAIVRHLVAPERCGGSRASGRLRAIGHGAGTRELAGVPNIVRALVFERAVAWPSHPVTLIEFDVDDMTGEEIGVACARLRAHADVLDVTIGTRIGKKGRPVTDVRLLASPDAAEQVAAACLTETSTLGLRMREERRVTIPREHASGTVDDETLRVKVAARPDGTHTAKVEHDDVAAVEGLARRRRRARAAERHALKAKEK